ncbi:MAG: SRPBCC family protein [Candidatus Promineifilaceae bacterium]
MTKPLRFEGTVRINAPCINVWNLIADVSTLERLMPSVRRATAISPLEQFEVQVGVPFWVQSHQQTFQVYWSNVVVGKRFDWLAITPWAGEPIETHGVLRLADETTLTFSAEVTPPPSAPPRQLLHRITEQAIRSYFTSLKREAEEVANRENAKVRKSL